MSDFGVASMIAPLRRVLVRRPATAGDWDGAAWRAPDPARLEAQHEAFCALLAGSARRSRSAAALEGQVDAVYMHDPMVMTGRGGIPLRMAKPVRRREPEAAARELERLGIPVLGTLADARVRRRRRPLLDRRATMAVGIGYRTNRAGAAALAELAAPRASPSSPTTSRTTAGPGMSCTCSRSSRAWPTACA